MYTVPKCLVLCCIFVLFDITDGYQSRYANAFGEGFGKEWYFVSDDNGGLHYVNLTEAPFLSTRKSLESLGDINFRLFTRKNIKDYEDISDLAQAKNNIVNLKFRRTNFNRNVPTKVITHGWKSSANSDSVRGIKDAYLKKYDYNVIAVDWSETANEYLYPKPAWDTRYVGERVAGFLDSLAAAYDIDGSHLHLIGHSLGAHVMGVAALKSRLKISRVTGLDPAGPFFEVPLIDDPLRLDKSDADLVDVIHTSAGFLGYGSPLGDADFFPNGGFTGQPGCKGLNPVIGACSHGRSHQYFADSIISPSRYKAFRCDSWEHFTKGLCFTNEAVFMGDALKSNVHGSYYLFADPPPGHESDFLISSTVDKTLISALEYIYDNYIK